MTDTDALIDETDRLIAESEARLQGYADTFEEEATRLRAHRQKLISARERTDKMIARVERTARVLKPESTVLAGAKAKAKGKPKAAYYPSDEEITKVREFVGTFLKDHDILITQDVKDAFPEWKNKAKANACINRLNEERFVRIAGFSPTRARQYKLTAEARQELGMSEEEEEVAQAA